ncbi:Stk1 family PASTA domain-containing Ser/Thr kinase [Pedococcus sp. 5OH_020]|uniref:Stk1 family PASTA domain-containing Ser/Thr kinase n=1 Tax=Pedococcus sp. 5OH_020 TaxID=2989814 RepID=UPI0022E99DD5|nr:Stk1 family PASTA domain-containing Ser/Thr kinase [Pedococcus sp. 5OH_020]
MTAPRLLGGRYEVGELIGRGGMAEVHLGYDTRLSRPVAIKMLRSDLARDTSFLNRFRREAQSAAGLNHASIVAVYDSGEDKLVEAGGASVPVPYIVMEYVEGRTLREVLNERSPLDPAEAARITEGILDALAYSHRMGIVHRDIKPANVMVTPHGGIKVMDFGIARAVADANATMTQTQAVIGTAQYLSPEQAQGHHVDNRSDLYSTGCLLFELLTGRPPFQADSPVAIAYQHVGQPPPRPSSFNPEVGHALDAVVLHALNKDREARYQDATAFRADLQAARLGRPISDGARGTAVQGADATVALGAGVAAAAAAAARGAGGAIGSAGSAGATTVIPSDGAYETPAPVGDRSNTASLPAIGHDPDDEPRRRRGLAYVLLVMAVVGALVLLVLAGKGLLDRPPQGSAQVAVPSVVDLPVETAEAAVRAAGLVPEATQVASSKEVGHVVEQSPGADERVDRGSKVDLSVSAGPDTAEVPDLKGYSLDEAKTFLGNLGLGVGAVTKVDDSGIDEGKVVSTSPDPGSSVAVGSKVALNVSSGLVTVPDVVGKARNDAVDALGNAGLRAKTTYVPSTQPENTVLKQSVKAGSKVADGTTVSLTVAQPALPTPTTVTTTAAPPTTATRSPSPTTTTATPPGTPTATATTTAKP